MADEPQPLKVRVSPDLTPEVGCLALALLLAAGCVATTLVDVARAIEKSARPAVAVAAGEQT